MICEDTYRSCLATLAPRENAARIARDGNSGKHRNPNQPTGCVDETTILMMRHMVEPIATDELSAIVGITNKSVSNRTHGLRQLGWVASVGSVVRKEKVGGRKLNVWQLTPLGMEKINA